MKNFSFRRFFRIEPLLALAAAVCLFIAVFVWKRPGMRVISPSVNAFFVLQPQSVTEEAIDDYAGVRRVYEFDLSKAPDNKGRGRSVFVYLRHTVAVLEMEGKTPADTGERADQWHIGRTPGNYWLTLPIYADYGGKVLRITLTPVYDSVRDDRPLFLLIDREPLITLMLLPKEGAMLALSVLAAVAGAFLSLTALALELEPKARMRAFYLGAVAVTGGLWKLGSLSVTPLLLDHLGKQKAIWFIAILSYLLMLLFSLRLTTLLRPEGSSRAGRACCAAGVLAGVLLLGLQIAGVAELHDTVAWFGVGASILHVPALLDHRPGRGELVWLVPTALALWADLALFRRSGNVAAAPVFLLWLVVNLFLRGFGFLRAALRQERELREARTQNLIRQIQPHFISNSLAAIHMLCAEDPARAMRAIADFSDYLHANFDALAVTEPVAFLQELGHTKAYLGVQQACYAEKLSVEYHTEFITFSLPPLTLQPIVENCVKHGLAETHRPMHIVIRTRAAAEGAEITVEDDGPGCDPAQDGALHIGLQNVRERLKVMCGGTLTVAARPNGGTAVTVFVPKREA